MRLVFVQTLNVTGTLGSFWKSSIDGLFYWILCGRIHDLSFPVVRLNCCLRFYQSRLILVTGLCFQHLRKDRLIWKVLKKTTIKPRVGENVAVIVQLRGENHTTVCCVRLIQVNVEYEVPQEDLYSAEKDCVVKDKKSDSTLMSTLVSPSCNPKFDMELNSRVYLTESVLRRGRFWLLRLVVVGVSTHEKAPERCDRLTLGSIPLDLLGSDFYGRCLPLIVREPSYAYQHTLWDWELRLEKYLRTTLDCL